MNPESLELQKEGNKESIEAAGSQVEQVVEGETPHALAYEETSPAAPTPVWEAPQYQSNDSHQASGNLEDRSDVDD